ncbi:MAG: type II toxin-antitoxin system death-on-curing family toxin [Acidobacteria bacterium]|nr:type II toxin-antitoxin system death-on-curing family toxin [Acidobacteriota bacterium]
MRKPIWIRENVVIAIHERQLVEHGGTEGVRDRAAFESALARPKNRLAYGDPKPDIAALAAAYAYGIVSNHPFVDGNKRTAFTVCRTFLKLNGWDIAASQEEKYLMFLRLAKGEAMEAGLARWIRDHRE